MCWICDIFADEDLVEQYTAEELNELEQECDEIHYVSGDLLDFDEHKEY